MTLNEAINAVRNESRNAYAVSYCDALPDALRLYGEAGVKVQILYILNNLGGWRGERAREVKAALKGFAK